jgi:hypothetical protein
MIIFIAGLRSALQPYHSLGSWIDGHDTRTTGIVTAAVRLLQQPRLSAALRSARGVERQHGCDHSDGESEGVHAVADEQANRHPDAAASYRVDERRIGRAGL